MTRRTKIGGWVALPLVLLAAGGLLWHVLACVESPMSFAPGGDLAFTTMEPYDSDAVVLRGTHVYRLMVLPAKASEPKVLEESADWMISAPGFSADGKRIAYFRIPLLTSADQARIDPQLKGRQEALEATTQPAPIAWPPVSPAPAPPTTQAAGGESGYQDMTMPPISMVGSFVIGAITLPVQLVERRAADGEILSVTPVELPVPMEAESEGMSSVLFAGYIVGRPQYTRDGQWISFCPGGPNLGGVAIVVCPSTKKIHMLGAAVAAACLSPDGKTLAVLHQGALGFVSIDGSSSRYVHWQGDISLAGLAWTANDTLAVLSSEKVDRQTVRRISLVKGDGTVSTTITLSGTDGGKDADTGQLALSPGAKSMVISFDEVTLFLNGSGKVLSTWAGDDEKGHLAQPTFSPNGKEVAFKLMRKAEGESPQAEAIVFFSPAGKELRRVASPPSTVPLTRPAASAPATDPARSQSDDF
jgi:hypothetical protein